MPSAAQCIHSSEDRLPGMAVVTRKLRFPASWGFDCCVKPSSPMHEGGYYEQLGDESEPTDSHDSRPSRLRTVTDSSTLFSHPPLHVTIPAVSTDNSISNLFGQNVSGLVNTTASLASPSSPAPHSAYQSSVSSVFNFNQHGLIKLNNRPRTSNQVFNTGEELALYYDIPTLLPPPPTSPILDFEMLPANYTNMISKNPTANMVVGKPVPTPAELLPTLHMENPDVALEEWMTTCTSVTEHVIESEPELASPRFQELLLLTSPAGLQTLAQDFESSPNETPYSDFLSTPLLGISDDDSLFRSPVVNSDSSLFATDEEASSPDKTKSTELPELPEMLHQMMPLPENDFVNPALIYSSPTIPRPPTPTVAILDTSTRRSSATRICKNIKPDKLIPLDAPTQPWGYLTDTAMARKAIPVGFQKKRKRMGCKEDELLERLPPNATEIRQIESKRRQNTLAARKSRHRKLIYQQELEDKAERLSEDVTRWQTRCDVLSKLLQSHGIPPPMFDE